MKPKKYESVNYIAVKESINRDFKILSIFSILITIVALILSINCMKLAIENDSLKLENKQLNKVIQMKDSMIADVQEDNIKLQEMIDNVKNKR